MAEAGDQTISPYVDAGTNYGASSNEGTPLLAEESDDELPNLNFDDPDEEPEEEPRKKKTSNTGTFLHLLKGNVGTGILAMPIAISNFGLMAGTFGIILLGAVCLYCMQLLVYSTKVAVGAEARRIQRQELQKNTGTGYAAAGTDAPVAKDQVENNGNELETSLNYDEVAFEAFSNGPRFFRPWALYMKFIVNLLLILTQFGFCCVYFLFVGQSLHEVSLNMQVFTSLSTQTIMAIELPFLILLNFIPNLDMLTGVSITAVGLQAVGLLLMFLYFVQGPMSDNIIPYIAPLEKWPLFFGTAMFSFEGIGVVLPLENEMKKKKSFKTILNTGMTVVVCLYLLIGIGGYVKYGMDVKPSITFNLPVGCFSELIRLAFALAIFLTYPLQMYVPFKFVIPYLKGKLVCSRCNRWGELAIDWTIRAILVSITFGIAVGVPMLDLVISLVGSVASNGLALILPPFIHAVSIAKYRNIRYKKLQIGFDIFLSLFGIFGLIVGATTTIYEMNNKNATEVALDHASYNELISSGMPEAIALINLKNTSCCTLFS